LPVKQSRLKEYMVRVGDSLSTIAEAQYGTSKPIVVDFLARFNKTRIKSKHELLAGQKLEIPELPADLFEKVHGFDATKIVGSTRTATLEELAKTGQRRAPLPAKKSTARDAMTRAGSTGAIRNRDGADVKAKVKPKRRAATRWYEVKPKDTFISIARKQLGSVGLWKEIQKLNPKVDSRKMRPGDRLRLPNKPVTEAFKKRRGSA